MSQTSLTCAGISGCNARVASAVYDERANRWQIHTAEGHRARAQFVIAAVGVLSAHYVPDFAGLESFKGAWRHTGRWPKDGLEVAASGWGSSAPGPAPSSSSRKLPRTSAI